VQALREHYPMTLRAWTANLRRHWHTAVSLVGSERARAWELYMTASAVAFERDRIGVNQILAVRPTGQRGQPDATRTTGSRGLSPQSVDPVLPQRRVPGPGRRRHTRPWAAHVSHTGQVRQSLPRRAPGAIPRRDELPSAPCIPQYDLGRYAA
jgi:hypothetical protein